MRRVLETIDTVLSKAVALLVMAVLLSMVGFAFLQVILRNLFESGIPWADVVLRNLVLWVGMLGGLLATRQGRQISIDILTRISGPGIRTILYWASSLFTVIVTVLLAKASYVFVSGEREFGSTLFNDFPAWYAQIILPVGFALIGFQVLLNLALGRVGAHEALRDNASEITDTTPTESNSIDEESEDQENGQIELSSNDEDEPDTETQESSGDEESDK